MIGSFWNIRGLGQHGKLQCLGDFLNNHKVDFVGFFETKKENIHSHTLNSIASGTNFSWHVLPANKTVGGIFVGLKKAFMRSLVL